MEIQVPIDVSLLVLRCLYFAMYFEFYDNTESDIEYLSIQIPFHPLMTIPQCISYLTYLSFEEKACYKMFDKIKDIESIVFFSSFFQSNFLFKYIYKRGLKNVDEVAEILKVALYTGSDSNKYIKKLLYFTADFLHRPSVQSVLDDMCCHTTRAIHPHQSYNSYRTDVIYNDMEDKMFLHEYQRETLSYKCAVCGKRHTASRIPRDNAVVYMDCCGSPACCICYTNFRFRSFFKKDGKMMRCRDCGMRWTIGKPSCGSILIRWQKKKYRKMRTELFEDRISFFCDEN